MAMMTEFSSGLRILEMDHQCDPPNLYLFIVVIYRSMTYTYEIV